MVLHEDTAKSFISYLKEHGYPEESIATEYKIGNNRIDIAVIDPKTKLPIQIFELKARKNEAIRNMGKKQLQNYLSQLDNENVPAYLVFPSDNEPGFEIESVRKSLNIDNEIVAEAQSSIISLNNRLNYIGNRNARISEKVEIVSKQKGKTINALNWICWLSCPIVLIIGILNYLKVLKLTAIDISFLASVIGLLIIPFASKLKILGIELERYKKEE